VKKKTGRPRKSRHSNKAIVLDSFTQQQPHAAVESGSVIGNVVVTVN
jgi:hypothetical protein